MASDECKGKSSWPELVGKKGEDAAARIEKENPHVNAVIGLEGSFVTDDFLCTRVRVWVITPMGLLPGFRPLVDCEGLMLH